MYHVTQRNGVHMVGICLNQPHAENVCVNA